MTDMVFMCGDIDGDDPVNSLSVVVITPLDFKARRSIAKPFCCIRAA